MIVKCREMRKTLTFGMEDGKCRLDMIFFREKRAFYDVKLMAAWRETSQCLETLFKRVSRVEERERKFLKIIHIHHFPFRSLISTLASRRKVVTNRLLIESKDFPDFRCQRFIVQENGFMNAFVVIRARTHRAAR